METIRDVAQQQRVQDVKRYSRENVYREIWGFFFM